MGLIILLTVLAVSGAVDAILLLGPTLIAGWLGFPRTSLLIALATAASVCLDHLRNFSSVSYPHPVFSLPEEMFPWSILVALGGISLGIRNVSRLL